MAAKNPVWYSRQMFYQRGFFQPHHNAFLGRGFSRLAYGYPHYYRRGFGGWGLLFFGAGMFFVGKWAARHENRHVKCGDKHEEDESSSRPYSRREEKEWRGPQDWRGPASRSPTEEEIMDRYFASRRENEMIRPAPVQTQPPSQNRAPYIPQDPAQSMPQIQSQPMPQNRAQPASQTKKQSMPQNQARQTKQEKSTQARAKPVVQYEDEDGDDSWLPYSVLEYGGHHPGRLIGGPGMLDRL